MPTYEYRCPKCGFETEITRGMSDQVTEVLCDCKTVMERVYSCPAIKVSCGTSPSRASGSSRPKDAIPLSPTHYAVPRRDKNGNLVRMKDLKGPGDLPKDMQKLWKSRQEKHHMIMEQNKK